MHIDTKKTNRRKTVAERRRKRKIERDVGGKEEKIKEMDRGKI